MSKKLQLVVNNRKSGVIPPSTEKLKKAIRVTNSKSARRLLSRLIVGLQRGEVFNEDAKDLTYLLNSFIALMKYSAEENEISDVINKRLHIYLRQLQIFSDQFFAEVETLIPPDKLLFYRQKFAAMVKKFSQESANTREKILKEISQKTSLKPKIQTNSITSETAKAVVMNYLRVLPEEVLGQIITEIQREYFS